MHEPPATIGMYNILRPLGAGGMGVVYLGEHTIIRRQVAVKIIKANLEGQTHLSRFIREAVLLSEAAHPNIITLYDVSADGPLWYFVMEYMPGGSVADVLATRRLDWREATLMLLDACRGLQAAHQRQILHRDVKPSNLLVNADGRVKLADFGLAKARQESLTPLSSHGVLGTPRYMSPEQCRAETVTERSDIYALGGTYYTFLTGEVPFAHATEPMQMMFAHCESTLDVAPLQRMPPGCRRIVERAMAKEPRQRYPDCAAMIADLEELLANPGDTTPPQRNQSKRRSTPTPDLAAILPLDERSTQLEPPPNRRRWLLAAGAGVGTLTLGGLGIWWGTRPRTTKDAPTKPRAFTVSVPAVPFGLQYSPDGRWLATAFRSGAAGVRIWNAATGEEAGHFWPTNAIQQLAWSADSTMIAAVTSGLGRAHLLHLQTRREYTVRNDLHDRDFCFVAAWPDKAPFIVVHDADDRNVVRFATLNVESEQLLEGTRQSVNTTQIVELVTKEGLALSTHRDKHLCVWRLANDTLTQHERFPVPNAAPDTFRLALNATGDRVAVSAGKSVWFYPMPVVAPQGRNVALPHDAWAMQFTPNGKHLIVAGSQVSLIEVETGKVSKLFSDPNETVYRIALHPLGTHLALSLEGKQGKRVEVRPVTVS